MPPSIAPSSAIPAHEAAISLGSNLGDRLANLTAACQAVANLTGVKLIAASTVYETDPVGVADAYKEVYFLNAVAIFSLPENMTAEEFSTQVHAIEDQLGRDRDTADRYAPRTIDLDLLYVRNIIQNSPALTLPHPQCNKRRFVLHPLADLRPNLILPNQTQTLAEILTTLPASPTVWPHPEQWQL